MKYKVFIPQDIEFTGKRFLEDRGYDVIVGKIEAHQRIRDGIDDCDALLLRTAIVDKKTLEMAKNLKVISRYGVGVDNIDLVTAKQLGVWVTNSPDGNVNSVAEHTMGLVMVCAKNMLICDQEMRKGNFNFREQLSGYDLKGKTLGLVGFGKIAHEVAKKAAIGFDMNVLSFDPFIKNESFPEYVISVSKVEDIFSKSNFVSIHIPATKNNRNFVNIDLFKLMKKDAYFINTSRGEVVCEKDLIEVLKTNKIRGAGLDVYSKEPPDLNNPLLSLNNIFLTPHNAGLTKESVVRVALDAAKGIDDVLSGRFPEFPIVIPSQ